MQTDGRTEGFGWFIQRRVYEAFQVGGRRILVERKSEMGIRRILRWGHRGPGLQLRDAENENRE